MFKVFFIILIINSVILSQSDLTLRLINNEVKYDKMSFEVLTPGKIKINITDNYGEGVRNLKISDFEIFEQGYKAKLTSLVPLSEATEASIRLFLCLDNSDSMEPYIEEMLKILDDLIDKFPRGSNIELLTFDETNRKGKFIFNEVETNIKTSNYFAQKNLLKNSYQNEYKNFLTRRTYLNDQIFAAFSLANLEKNKNEDLFFVIFSDGFDVGSKINSSEAVNQYQNGNVLVVDFSRGAVNPILKRLVDVSKGLYFNAKNVNELANYFSQIGDKIIFSGYELTYESQIPPQLVITGIYDFKSNQNFGAGTLKIEEVKSREFFPLLNYVFFEKNNSDFKKNYLLLNKNQVSDFDEKKIEPNQLTIYNNILNIIASRAKKDTSVYLTIVGCNDNLNEEKNNLALSKLRAETVKKYFVETWQIDSNRIKIETKNLPGKPSNNTHALGQEENRRVEIYSSNPSILDLVEAFSISKIADPEILKFDYKLSSNIKVKSWLMEVKQRDKVLYSQKGDGELQSTLTWNVAPSLANQELINSDIVVHFNLWDIKGDKSNPTVQRINIDYKTQEEKKVNVEDDKFVEKVSLVLFEFNSSDLDVRNKDALMKLKNSVTDKSTIIINGFTDSSGPENLNKTLSEQRAKETSNSIKKLFNINTENLSYFGLGKSVPLYDNSLPQGRFYNRTCQIIIETPISE